MEEEDAWERAAVWGEGDLCTLRTTGPGECSDMEAGSRKDKLHAGRGSQDETLETSWSLTTA